MKCFHFRDQEEEIKEEQAENLEAKSQSLQADLLALRTENRDLAAKFNRANK